MRIFLQRVWNLYYEGFKNMTVGKTLWALILIKLLIIFAILKVFFFQPFLHDMDDEQSSNYVAKELIDRADNKK